MLWARQALATGRERRRPDSSSDAHHADALSPGKRFFTQCGHVCCRKPQACVTIWLNGYQQQLFCVKHQFVYSTEIIFMIQASAKYRPPAITGSVAYNNSRNLPFKPQFAPAWWGGSQLYWLVMFFVNWSSNLCALICCWIIPPICTKRKLSCPLRFRKRPLGFSHACETNLTCKCYNGEANFYRFTSITERRR